MRFRSMNERGVTMIELMIAVIISAIALMAVAIPFFAERSFWARGKRQSEAQRDAQMILRAIARVARESSGCDASSSTVLSCTPVSGGDVCFQRSGGQFQMGDCGAPVSAWTTLLDGTKSALTQFNASEGPKIVKIQLEVTREGKEKALLETHIFARNYG